VLLLKRTRKLTFDVTIRPAPIMRRRPIDVAWLPRPVPSNETGRMAERARCRPAVQSPGGVTERRVCRAVTSPCHEVRSAASDKVVKARETVGSEANASPRSHDTVQPVPGLNSVATSLPPPQQRVLRSTSSPSDSPACRVIAAESTDSPVGSNEHLSQTSAAKRSPCLDSVQRFSNPAVNIGSTFELPSRSASLPSASDISTTRQLKTEHSLNIELKRRLKDLFLQDVGQNKKIVNQLSEKVLDELRKNNPRYHWDTMNSGSYYEKTKVRETYHLVFVLTTLFTQMSRPY